MKFIDYYEILDISHKAELKGIKRAFRKQALIWHPDRNPNQSNTEMMQLINEAYLILKDNEARQHYDLEYQKYKSFKLNHYEEFEDSCHDQEEKENIYNYNIQDETLEKWMQTAKKQAIDLAIKTIKDLKGMSKAGTKAAIEEVKSGLEIWLYMIIFMLVMWGLIIIVVGNR